MTWVNVYTEYPPIGEFEDVSIYVLVTDGERIGIGTRDFSRNVWTYSMAGIVEQDDNAITHWCFFPPPPKQILGIDCYILRCITYIDNYLSAGNIDMARKWCNEIRAILDQNAKSGKQ